MGNYNNHNSINYSRVINLFHIEKSLWLIYNHIFIFYNIGFIMEEYMKNNCMIVGIAIGVLAGVLFTRINFTTLITLALGIWIGYFLSNKK